MWLFSQFTNDELRQFSMTQRQHHTNNDEEVDIEKALEYECLKFDSAHESQTTSPAFHIHMMDIDYGGNNDNNEMPQIENDIIEKIQLDTSVEHQADGDAIFGFSRMNYMDSVRAWSTTGNVIEGDTLPAMIRANSGSLSSSDADDSMSSSSGGSEDDAGKKVARCVTFNESVRVMPIPPLESYTAEQRFKMYANRFELRENKLRNKKEFQFDGYNWRHATEECHMAICPLSGEILHPAHL